eukprot:767714-Hanusia_phi.AAC.3
MRRIMLCRLLLALVFAVAGSVSGIPLQNHLDIEGMKATAKSMALSYHDPNCPPLHTVAPWHLRLRGGAKRDSGNGCFDGVLACLVACLLSPRMLWRDRNRDAKECTHDGEPLWASEEYDDQNEFDALTAGLNNRIGTLPNPTIEHFAIKKKRQLGAGGFAIVYEADAPRPVSSSGRSPPSGPCACKVFSFIAGMGERQTNFFKNWLHELKVLDYLSTRPECGVVDFYGFSLQHDQADAKIVVQICMELMRGGSLRDNLLVMKRKGKRSNHGVLINSCGWQVKDYLSHSPSRSCDKSPWPYGACTLLSMMSSGPTRKPSTIVCKLCDVGLAALRADPSLQTVGHATTKVGKAGTYPYIAPETLLQGKCTPASDVFRCSSVLMYVLKC